MRLSELLDGLPGLNRVSGDVEVVGATIDSRKASPGSVFICLPGTQLDSHEFIENAMQAGAVAAIVTKADVADRLKRLDIPFALVTDAVDTCWRICKRLYEDPTAHLKAVGVTGTNGKTTVAWLLRQALDACGLPCGYLGTLGGRLGERQLAASLTTPFPPETYALLAGARRQGARAFAMEVSSHALTQRRVDGLEFDVGVFTNLSQDHLDFHKGIEEYFEAKRRLFKGLPSSKKIITVANADDPYGQRLLAEAERPFGFGERGEHARLVQSSVELDRLSFTVSHEGVEYEVEARLGARFNVSNCLAVFAAAVALGIEPGLAARSLSKVEAAPGRFESIQTGADFKVIVDYAHTPDALEKLLQSVRELCPQRVTTVFGCGGDRDRTKRPKMAAAASAHSDALVVTSDNPRTEDPERIIADILPGISGEHTVEPDRRKAIEKAIAEARSGEVVVIAGKGHEDYQLIGSTKTPFDDRVVAAEAIEKRLSCV